MRFQILASIKIQGTGISSTKLHFTALYFCLINVCLFKSYGIHLISPFVTQQEIPQLSSPQIWPTTRNFRPCAEVTCVIS